MNTLGIVLIIIGIFYVYMLILRPPWVLNNIKVKIMIKGSSMLSFIFWRFSAYLFPSFILIFKKVGFTLNKTASNIEHKKERAIVEIA